MLPNRRAFGQGSLQRFGPQAIFYAKNDPPGQTTWPGSEGLFDLAALRTPIVLAGR